MKVGTLTAQPSAKLARKFSVFERQFNYPYGPDKRFRIEHGDDYNAFYRSMGHARTYFLEVGDRVIGAVSAAIKTVNLSPQNDLKLAYIGDLKIIPEYRYGKTILHLLTAMRAFLEENADLAYAVVMDGTDATPMQYTGRVNIPSFRPVTQQYILRIQTEYNRDDKPLERLRMPESIDEEDGWRLFFGLQQNLSFAAPANYHLRSEIPTQWVTQGHKAIGMIEDTCKAKRLYDNNNYEMRSSHLSYFAFYSAFDGAAVIRQGLELSREYQFPAMFVAVSKKQLAQLQPYLQDLQYEIGSATVYSTALLPEDFPINTSEI